MSSPIVIDMEKFIDWKNKISDMVAENCGVYPSLQPEDWLYFYSSEYYYKTSSFVHYLSRLVS